MDIYGLVGKNIGHSKSPEYFNNLFEKHNIDAEYKLFDIESVDELEQIIKETPNLKGLNVTIPYKRSLGHLIDHMDDESYQTGSINLIKIIDKNGKKELHAFNSDVHGFESSITPVIEKYPAKRALILGTGGVAHTVAYVFRKLGVFYYFVSRMPAKIEHVGYNWLNDDLLKTYSIIVNCTPLGMTPDIDSCPDIPYEKLTSDSICFDCVYNPKETLFLKKAAEKGAHCIDGTKMFEDQAKEAWRLWFPNV